MIRRATPHLRELDSLRGLAALAIVFWHYSVHFHATPKKKSTA